MSPAEKLRKRRVSFSVPDEQPSTVDTPSKVAVSVSVDDDSTFDADVETPFDPTQHPSDSDDSDSEDSHSEHDHVSKQPLSKHTREGNHVAPIDPSKKRPQRSARNAVRPNVQAKRQDDDDDGDEEDHDDSENDSDEEDEDVDNSDNDNDNAKNVVAKDDNRNDDRGKVDNDDDEDDDEYDEDDDEEDNDEDQPRRTAAPEDTAKSSAIAPAANAEAAPPSITSFADLSLDPRLARAIEREGWRRPTPVQCAVLPVALSGRDVLVSAPTGSGKTAAYAIPLLAHLCRPRHTSTSPTSSLRAVILVPTRELVHQVSTVCKQLARFVHGLRVAGLSGLRHKAARRGEGSTTKAAMASDKMKDGSNSTLTLAADVVVGTPAAIAGLREVDGASPLRDVEFVVVDEADLVLSYGGDTDARAVLSKVPAGAQAMLLSATLEAEGMDAFKKVILRRPLTVKVTTDGELEDGDPTGAAHYLSRLTNSRDRYLVTFAMLRLGVICGKVLIFVNHINSAFKLKLFLDQFKIKSAVLNSELPANSRIHCVEQFNAGIVDILIATDESQADLKREKDGKKNSRKDGRKRKRVDKDEEFGLSRGVDFRNVAAVLNFDVPISAASYTHRAGRTARGGKSGTVLTLVASDKDANAMTDACRELGVHIGPLAFRMDQVEVFRYRVEDCLRVVTDTAVNGARLADVQRELVNAETLKDYFEDNPNDLDALQHNLRLAKNIPEHLGHIPSYLVPAGMREVVEKTGMERRNGGRRRDKSRRRVSANPKGKTDPLKGFSVSGSSRQRFQAKHGIKKKKSNPSGQDRPKRKRNW